MWQVTEMMDKNMSAEDDLEKGGGGMPFIFFLKNNLLWMMGAIVIISVLALSCVTWRWADDFSLYNDLKNHYSVFEKMWHNYTHWDGRALSVGHFLTSVFTKYFPPEPTIFIWAFSFVMSALIFVKILLQEIGDKNLSVKESIILTALIVCVLWLGMGLHISETIYWVSGGFYTFSNFLGLTWVYYLNKIQKAEHCRHRLRIALPLFVFSLITGMSSQNLSTALLVFLGLTWLQDRMFSEGKKEVLYIAAALGLIAGTALLFLAPGNFIRAAYGSNSFALSPETLFINYLRVLIYYVNWSGGLLILSIMAAWLISHMGQYVRKIHLHREIRDLKLSQVISELFGTFKYLFAALATIVPFIMVPTFAFSYRTSIFFMTFLSLFVVLFINWLNVFSYENAKFSSFLQPIAKMLLLCLFVAQIGLIIVHFQDGFRIKGKILERESYLQKPELKNTDVVLPPLETGHVPFSLRFGDIGSDQNNWVNLSVAKFYNLKSIRIGK